MILWALFLLFGVFWICYWEVIYTYLVDKVKSHSNDHIQTEITGNTTGFVVTLLSSLLLLPASRTGLWVDVFGVSYERILKYHRILGAMCYFMLTLHALVWWLKFAVEGTLENNIVSHDTLQLSPTFTTHHDFTLPLVELVWLLLTLSLVLAVAIRRKPALYAVFLYTHKYIGIFYYVVAIIHAWSFW